MKNNVFRLRPVVVRVYQSSVITQMMMMSMLYLRKFKRNKMAALMFL